MPPIVCISDQIHWTLHCYDLEDWTVKWCLDYQIWKAGHKYSRSIHEQWTVKGISGLNFWLAFAPTLLVPFFFFTFYINYHTLNGSKVRKWHEFDVQVRTSGVCVQRQVCMRLEHGERLWPRKTSLMQWTRWSRDTRSSVLLQNTWFTTESLRSWSSKFVWNYFNLCLIWKNVMFYLYCTNFWWQWIIFVLLFSHIFH